MHRPTSRRCHDPKNKQVAIVAGTSEIVTCLAMVAGARTLGLTSPSSSWDTATSSTSSASPNYVPTPSKRVQMGEEAVELAAECTNHGLSDVPLRQTHPNLHRSRHHLPLLRLSPGHESTFPQTLETLSPTSTPAMVQSVADLCDAEPNCYWVCVAKVHYIHTVGLARLQRPSWYHFDLFKCTANEWLSL